MSCPEKVGHSNRKKLGLMERFVDYVQAPGRQYTVQSAAPSIFANKNDFEDAGSVEEVALSIVGDNTSENMYIYNEKNKSSWGSSLFDWLTDIAGSLVIFLLTCAIILAWVIWGIVAKAPDNWQIAMQDGSSIQCYVSDTLLMRQQHNNTNRLLTILAQLRSRCSTVDRLVKLVQKNNPSLTPDELKELASKTPEDCVGDAAKLPTENYFDVCCNWVSEALGSLWSLALYWSGIIAWVCVGPSLGFTDEWQLYINTGVAVQLTFVSMFLQNTRRRHMNYLEKCLRCIQTSDQQLEVELRQATKDNTPNPIVSIAPLPVSRGVRFIDYYGDVIGTGIGAFISLCVFIAWFAIGDSMNWNDDWWLIIGTYTGLVGFIDGFVLRNVYFRQDTLMDEQFNVLADNDKAIYQFLNLSLPKQNFDERKSFGQRLSNRMGDACSHPIAVLFSVLVVIALICAAGALKFNTTAQLFCNTPTMIIEGFLLIVLLQAHNLSNTIRRFQMKDILLRRLRLLQYVRVLSGSGNTNLVDEMCAQNDSCNEKTEKF